MQTVSMQLNNSAVIEVSSRLLSLSGYSVQLESAVGSVSLTGKRKEFSAHAHKALKTLLTNLSKSCYNGT